MDRQRIAVDLLRMAGPEGELSRGALSAIALRYDIQPSTASRLCQRAKEEAELTGLYVALSRMHISGRQAEDRSEELGKLRQIDFAARSTVRSAAVACGVLQTTLHRRIKGGDLRKVTSVVKPLLTEANRHARLPFCVSHINMDTHLFADMLDTVHVDKKLFYVTETTRRFLILPALKKTTSSRNTRNEGNH
ncbi:uncharacterized protein KRP23_7599 [Phytophthora ramorum]|uniref:uncharacterized protein n=1 Tax=Phytophthora ramorum TaxID=164328 RepID=UPI00309BBF40|nr:hypothetical protein KRP23_7599 [Phytophthora ramorum]